MFKKIFLLIALISLLLVIQPVWAASFGESLNKTANDAGVGQGQNLTLVAAQVVKGVFSVLGILFVVLLIYGGVLWMTAMADEKKISKAKNTITAAVIGLIIVIAAYAIAFFIANALEAATISRNSSTLTISTT